jgi:hypothetical protein
MALQRNVSRILSEEDETPGSLFFMEGVVGRASVYGKPPTVMSPCPQISFSVINNAVWSPLALPSLAG